MPVRSLTKLNPAEDFTEPHTTKASSPTVSALQPNQSAPTDHLNVTLIGTGFQPDATVRLVQGGHTIIADPVQVESSTKITFNLNIQRTMPIGKWNVVITNPDNQTGILSEGFDTADLKDAKALLNELAE